VSDLARSRRPVSGNSGTLDEVKARAASLGDVTDDTGISPVERLALRPKEAAKALGVSERTLRPLLPHLPHLRAGGTVLLPVRDLERWLHEQARAEADARRERVAGIVREGLAALAPPKRR